MSVDHLLCACELLKVLSLPHRQRLNTQRDLILKQLKQTLAVEDRNSVCCEQLSADLAALELSHSWKPGFTGCKRLLPRLTKEVERARGSFHPINMNLTGMKQNTITNDQLLFWCSLDMEHRNISHSINDKESIFKQEVPADSLEVTFFTTRILQFLLYDQHASQQKFCALMLIQLLCDSNNQEGKNRLIVSKQTAFIFTCTPRSQLSLTYESCPKERQESLNNQCSQPLRALKMLLSLT